MGKINSIRRRAVETMRNTVARFRLRRSYAKKDRQLVPITLDTRAYDLAMKALRNLDRLVEDNKATYEESCRFREQVYTDLRGGH